MDATLRFLTTIATVVEGISLDAALRLVEASNDFRLATPHPLSTHEGRVQVARENDAIVEFIATDKKILAIKALRTILNDAGVNNSLLDAKNAIDTLAQEVPRRTIANWDYSQYSSPNYTEDYDEQPF